MEEHYNLLADLLRQQYEKIIRDVLKQVLKREPHTDDFKEVTIYYSNDLDIVYYIAYKGIRLGRITQTGGVGPTFTLTFTPDEKYI